MIHPDRNAQVGENRRLLVNDEGVPVIVEDGHDVRASIVGFTEIKVEDNVIEEVKEALRRGKQRDIFLDQHSFKVKERLAPDVADSAGTPSGGRSSNNPNKP